MSKPPPKRHMPEPRLPPPPKVAGERGLFEPPPTASGKPDAVDHPPHYKAGGLEAIDIIEAFGLGFHLGNAVKYILRAGRKHPGVLEDLKKARWYIDRAIKSLEGPA